MAGDPTIGARAAEALASCADSEELLRRVAKLAHESFLPELSADSLFDSLSKREALGSTATPEGVALPHAITSDITAPGIVALTLRSPVVMGSHPVRIVVALFGSTAEPWVHVRTLARVARICTQPTVRDGLMSCQADGELLDYFNREFNVQH